MLDRCIGAEQEGILALFSRLFDLNAPFWQFLGRVADVVWLNLLFLGFSLPIVTAGASLSALFECARKVESGSGGSTTLLFLAAFRSNFRKGTVLWLAMGAAGSLLAASWLYVQATELLVLKALLTFVYLLGFPFVWALQARFENTVWHTLKNAFVVAFARLPLSVGVFGVHLAAGALVVASAVWFRQGLILLFLLGYSLVVFAATPLLERAMAPLLASSAESSDERM